MAIGDDFSINRITRVIDEVGGSTNYEGLELHRWLSDVADDASSIGDDQLDITDPIASDKAFDTIINLLNGYTITDAVSRRLFKASITQGSGPTLTRFSGIAIAGSFPSGQSPQIFQNNIKVTNFWGNSYNPDPDLGFSHQFMIKTIDNGTTIDGGRVRGQFRGYGFDYREASTVLGVAFGVLPLGNIQPDAFNNVTAVAVDAAPYDTVANDSEGYILIDLNNGNGDQPFYAKWNPNSTDNSGLYNRLKYLTMDGTSSTLYGLNGESFRGVTHEITVDGGSGTWNNFEPISWPTGTGQMLAVDNTVGASATKMWMQLLTGVAPIDNQTITGTTSSAAADVNVTVVERNLPTNSIMGSYFGSVLGGFGVGIDQSFLTASDQITDLNNTSQTPPNNVMISVSGLEGGVSEQDYVLLGRNDGSSELETDTYSANGAQASSSSTYVVNELINLDDPASGFVRIFNAATNSFNKVAYTSYSGSTFTLSSTIGFDVLGDAESFVPFLDGLASGGILGDEDGSITSAIVFQGSNIPVVGSVRNGNTSAAAPIKAFPLSGNITSSGFSVTAVRTRD